MLDRLIRPWLNSNTIRKSIEFVLVLVMAFPLLLVKLGPVMADGLSYLHPALNYYLGNGYIVFGESWLQEQALRPPLYSILIALSFWINGISVESAFWIPKFFSLLMFGEVYILGRLLWGRKAGLAALALVASSTYLVLFQATLFIDVTPGALELLALLLLLLAYQSSKRSLFFISGAALGVSFWVKEIAILHLSWPLITYFLIKPYRIRNPGFWPILLFWLGFASIAGGWWLYAYQMTGQIYMLNSWASVAYLYIFWLVVLLALLGLIITVIYWFVHRDDRIRRLYQQLRQQYNDLFSTYLPLLIGWSALVVTTLIYISIVGNYGRRMESLAEIPLRLTAFAFDYFPSQVIPEHPLLWGAPVAWGYIAYRAIIRKQASDTFLLLISSTLLPLILLVSVKDKFIWNIRQIFLLYPLSYIVIGYTLLSIIETISRHIKQWGYVRLSTSVVQFGLTGLMVFGFTHSILAIIDHNQTATQPNPHAWNSPYVIEISHWMKSHLPPGAKIMTTTQFASAFYFFTSGQYLMRKLPLKETRLEQRSNKLLFIDTASQQEIYNVADMLYLSQDNRGIYSLLLERSLIEAIQNQEIDFLIVARGLFSYNLYQVLDYFENHPAFEKVYEKSWDIWDVRIYKLNREELDKTNFPAAIKVETARTLLFQVNNSGGDYSLDQVLKVLGQKPVQLIPDTPAAIPIYEQLAEAYVPLDINIAAFEYQQALAQNRNLAANYLYLAKELVQQYQDYSGPWALLGDVYQKLGNHRNAEAAYLLATHALYSQPEILASAHRGLGQLYLADEQYQQAVAQLEQALDLTALATKATRVQLLFAKGNLYQTERRLDQATLAYKEALAVSENELAATFLDKASLAQSRGEYEKALTVYRQAFTLTPDGSAMRQAIVQAYVTLNQPDSMADLLDQVLLAYRSDLAGQPDQLQPYWDLAQAYEQLDRIDEAIAVYARAVANNPDLAEAHLRLGQAYETQQKIEAAIAEYQRAIALEPTLPGAYTRLGSLYRTQDRLDEAVGLYRTASKNNPETAWPHVRLGQLYLEQANLQ